MSRKKFKNLFNKGLAFFTALEMGLSTGAAMLFSNETFAENMPIVANNENQNTSMLNEFRRLGYFNDNDINNQTRIMMDGQNFLKDGYWMNASITPTGTDEAPSFQAKLNFIIPGYDSSRLRFYVLNKDATMPIETKEYKLSTSTQCCVPTLCLNDLKATSYEVHVYVDGLSEENFVAKAEFSCVPAYGGWGICSDNDTPVLDACGNQIISNKYGPLRLGIAKPYNNKLGEHQYLLALPAEVVPYYARTVKVVFFASERNGEPVNIDKTLYDYIYKGRIYPEGVSAPESFLVFAPDAQWGTDPSVKYEAHFYVDEVKEGNFICKAVGITNSAP